MKLPEHMYLQHETVTKWAIIKDEHIKEALAILRLCGCVIVNKPPVPHGVVIMEDHSRERTIVAYSTSRRYRNPCYVFMESRLDDT